MATITQLMVDEAFVECACSECHRIIEFISTRNDFEKCIESAKVVGSLGAVVFYSNLVLHVDEVLEFLTDCHKVKIAAEIGVLAEYLRDCSLTCDQPDDGQSDDDEIPF